MRTRDAECGARDLARGCGILGAARSLGRAGAIRWEGEREGMGLAPTRKLPVGKHILPGKESNIKKP